MHLPSDYKPDPVPLGHRLQVPKPPQIFAISAITILMYTVVSPDPDPKGGRGSTTQS